MLLRILICILIASQVAFAQTSEESSEEVPDEVMEEVIQEVRGGAGGAPASDANQVDSKAGTDKSNKNKNKKSKKSKKGKKTGEIAPAPQAPPEPLIKQAAGYLQGSQEGISDQVIILANQVDKLFGNTRALNEYYESSFRIYQKSYVNTKGSGSYDIQTNLNLSLPNWRNTEKVIQRWWSGETEVEEARVTKTEFKELNPWEFNQGVNLRFSRPVDYQIAGRLSKNFLTGPVVNHFFQEVSWDSARLWEEITSVTSDYALDKKNLFRFINEADWGISNYTFNSYHGPSFVYTIDKISLASFDLRLITGTQDNKFYTDNYTAGITYRTALHPLDWMFLQITPELSWPRIEHFTATWTLYVNLEIVFGKKKD
ncbi:hypothetical protein [Bdellovibrio svalbardensis]|uniref:DUF3078 domain-containing protein n=1 Tax=Bdellovibrio svalbardensis TaxID=2972972 RepID=A0ABT6DJ56_9BACT|nr:hypothetical protein [Bdellovibrio svalbardensis]MDG0816801.1 hypothetical protein [Bdellovibrio svalbardensis]